MSFQKNSLFFRIKQKQSEFITNNDLLQLSVHLSGNPGVPDTFVDVRWKLQTITNSLYYFMRKKGNHECDTHFWHNIQRWLTLVGKKFIKS